MVAPTLYYLIVELDSDLNMYEIWEQHKGQEKGCFLTDEQFVDFIPRHQLDEFICKYAENVESFGDKLDGVEMI